MKQRAAAKRHYQKNKDAMKARAQVYTKANRVRLRVYVQELKESTPCADCTLFFPFYVMEFDHVRGEKVGNIADMVGRGVSMKVLKVEIAKCDLTCANCHRVRTWTRLEAQSD